MRLDWPGCRNARDLGGLGLRPGALVRAGVPSAIEDWDALRAHGIRTVVDLRNDDELPGRPVPVPDDFTVIRFPLDGIEDREFWDAWDSGPQFGTPLYFRPWLERFPDRAAAALKAIAHAPPGGVLVHCSGGRDRSGLIVALLLLIVEVELPAIAEDYALSEGDDTEALAAYLRERGTTPRDALLAALDGFDPTALLEPHDVSAIRARLLTPRT